jgi:hypothetical protein
MRWKPLGEPYGAIRVTSQSKFSATVFHAAVTTLSGWRTLLCSSKSSSFAKPGSLAHSGEQQNSPSTRAMNLEGCSLLQCTKRLPNVENPPISQYGQTVLSESVKVALYDSQIIASFNLWSLLRTYTINSIGYWYLPWGNPASFISRPRFLTSPVGS